MVLVLINIRNPKMTLMPCISQKATRTLTLDIHAICTITKINPSLDEDWTKLWPLALRPGLSLESKPAPWRLFKKEILMHRKQQLSVICYCLVKTKMNGQLSWLRSTASPLTSVLSLFTNYYFIEKYTETHIINKVPFPHLFYIPFARHCAFLNLVLIELAYIMRCPDLSLAEQRRKPLKYLFVCVHVCVYVCSYIISLG